MKYAPHLLAAIAIVTTAAPAAAQTPVDNLRWLVGCWERSRPTSKTIERWNAPVDGIMTGESRIYSNSADRLAESLRLMARGDTAIYEASPVGQSRTEFRTTASGGAEVTFANPAHDFPQRIIYRQVGTDSM